MNQTIQPIEENISEKNREVSNERDSGSSYKNILKGASLLGGVQVFNILVNLIRGKFVAIILGPEGMGFSSLFTSASNTLQRFASLGVTQSIIRATATKSDNQEELAKTVSSSLTLNRLTALFGFLVCIVFSRQLSLLTFGNAEMTFQFMLLGVAVGFGIAGSGLFSVLQGLRQVKQLSRSSIIGSLTGLCIGVPLYYLFGINGIVPAIVAISLSLYLFYHISVRKTVGPFSVVQSFKEQTPLFKHLLALGLVLMSGELIATLVTYLINLYVRINGSVDTVGLYQAANTVTNQYAATVFAACALDYFPRLTKVSHDNSKMSEMVNRQSEVVAWLITPAMALLVISAPLLIRVLLSESFRDIIPLMRWMGLGIMLRAFSFPMAYISYAKGDKKVYFLLEGIAANLMTLILGCLGFHFFGLIGLGYALVIDNSLCILLYYIVNHRLYDYGFSRQASIQFFVGAILVFATFMASFIDNPLISFSLMGLTSGLAVVWAVLNLKSRI